MGASDGLWRSGDAGRTWQRTARFGAAVASEGLGRAGTGVVADVSLVSGGPIGRTNGDLYFSADGASWRRVAPVVKGFGDNHSLAYLTVAFDGTGVEAHGLAFGINPNPAIISGPLLHSSDGGRHWEDVVGLDKRSAGVQAVAFVPGSRTAFAAVDPHTDFCSPTLARSDDGGATWRPSLQGCAAVGISAVSFVDARHGFAAGQRLLVTDDAGRTWTATRSTRRTLAASDLYARLSLSGRDGTVLAGACSASRDRDLPCTGEVWATSDSGRSWTDTHLVALQLSSSGRTVIAAGGPGTPPGLSVSRDAGHNWSRVVAPGDVHVQQLTGSPNHVLALTNGVSAVSGDGGRTWRPAPAQVSSTPYQVVAQTGAVALRASYQHLERSSDGGHTWVAVALPSPRLTIQAGDIAFNRSDPTKAVVLAVDGSQHSEVLTSTDSGRTWAHASTVAATADGTVSYDDHSIVFTAGRLEVSHDDGRDFTRHAVGDDGYFLDSTGVVGMSVWVTGYVNDYGASDQVFVAHSEDGGRTWTQQVLAGLGLDPYDHVVPDVLPLSDTEALIAMNTGSLLRTTDAGRMWRQERPTLPVR